MTQFSHQVTGNLLGQSTRPDLQKQSTAAPDTDSRAIELVTQGVTVTPNLLNDHTRLSYTVAPNNSQAVVFSTPINMEDRSLHWIVIDNSNNNALKTFTFSPDYIFLDDPLGNNTYILNPGRKLIWFFAIVNGKLNLRLASTSTN